MGENVVTGPGNLKPTLKLSGLLRSMKPAHRYLSVPLFASPTIAAPTCVLGTELNVSVGCKDYVLV